MGVSLTLCACLVIVLVLGWRYHFEELARRRTIIQMAEEDKARSADLEKLGLSIDAGKGSVSTGPDAANMVLQHQAAAKEAERAISAPPVAAVTTGKLPVLPGTSATEGVADVIQPAFPPVSNIREKPLNESSDEVVQAIALLEKYWSTPNWKDRVPMVVDAARVEPLMRNYYETQKGVDPVPGDLISKARYEIDGMEILYFRYHGNRVSGTVEVALRRGSEARFQIDWESLTGYGELSFAEMRAERPVRPVLMRVYARQFEYYNYEFTDASRYYCVKLSSPDGEKSLYAYAQRGTPLGDWLSNTLAGTGPTTAMGLMVKVAFPPDAQSNQCLKLLQVTAPRWLQMP